MSRIKTKKKITIPPKLVLLFFTIVFLGILMAGYMLDFSSGILGRVAGQIFIPMQKSLTFVGNSLYDKGVEYKNLKNVMAENAELKEELNSLNEELNNIKLIQYDYDDLIKLLDLDSIYDDYPKVAASVVAKDAGNWFNSFVIDKGEKDGLSVGMNVIADGGLVGIISETNYNYSTVKTIIDDLSKVSAMVLSTSDNCIVSGDLEVMDKRQMIVFDSLKDSDNKVTVGDVLVTSYISSDYVQGLLIGTINELNTNSNNLTKSGYLTPAVDFEHIRHVYVITELKNTGEQ